MNEFQEIVYSLLYGENTDMVFTLNGMKKYVEDYHDLIQEISIICMKGNVEIIKDFIHVDGDNITWDLKINRK